MLTARVIPCLDVKDGRVVKGVRFENLRDAGSPAESAARYEAEGADEIVILDVAATNEARGARLETVRAVRERLALPLAVGGGVRSVAAAGELLDAGADKVAVNTAAVERPELVSEIATRLGAQCAVVAIDARRGSRGFEVVVRSATRATALDAVEWAKEAARRGAGEILLTSVDRDGTREGYDLELIAAVARAVSVPVIASGGAAEPRHLLEALRAGADAVLAASMFHDRAFSVGETKRALAAGGILVRTET